MSKKIAVVPCDGAGKEVVPEAVKVLRAGGADLAFEEFKVDADEYLRTGVAITDDTWKHLQAADSILFGAVGDPRVSDPIDWIEQIPFGETRNYVQRVLENTEVYRARLAGKDVPLQIAQDLYAPNPPTMAALAK